MKVLTKILKTVWTSCFYLNFVVSFLVLYPFFYLTLKSGKYRWAHVLKKIWAYFIFLLPGIKVRTFTEGYINPQKAYIFCPNHTSYLDVPLTRLAFPGYYLYMGKAELLKSFFFGIFFKTMDIVVNRESVISSHRAFVKAGQELEKGIGLVLFPEGTISEIVPCLTEFKPGPFRLAIKHKIPIVPVTIIDNWKLLPDKNRLQGRPGKARIIIHEPIETKDMTEKNISQLKDMVFKKIDQTLKNYGN